MLRYLLYNLIISFVKEFVNMAVNYRKTLISCYLGFITQAIAANFAPLLFLTFHNGYGIPFGKIALISSVFFVTQLIIDVLCARFADKIGYRKCVIGSQVFSALGLIGLAFLPELLPNPFSGIIISTVIYAMGSGLTEVLVSPIVEACPFEHKEAAMSLLHSFYCWGSVGVILISTLFFTVFGIENWKWLSCIWAIIPLVNVYNFSVCPIAHPVEDGEGMRIRDLLRVPLFWLAILLMVCAGASELSMAQWASAFAESALGLTKSVGDCIPVGNTCNRTSRLHNVRILGRYHVARFYKHLFGKNTHRRNCNVCTPRHGGRPRRSTRSCYCRKYHPECR